MARVLGYGGLANTNGARNFSGREEAAAQVGYYPAWQSSVIQSSWVDLLVLYVCGRSVL